MAVSDDDVRHVAELARLEIPPERRAPLMRELNDILGHMDVLAAVDPAAYAELGDGRTGGMPLRTDDGMPMPLERPRESFAPAMREGFFTVPRLASHEDADTGPSA